MLKIIKQIVCAKSNSKVAEKVVDKTKKNEVDMPEEQIELIDEVAKEIEAKERKKQELTVKLNELKRKMDEILEGTVDYIPFNEYSSKYYDFCVNIDQEEFLYCTIDKHFRKCSKLIVERKKEVWNDPYKRCKYYQYKCIEGRDNLDKTYLGRLHLEIFHLER